MIEITQAKAAKVTFDGMNFDLDDLPTNEQLQDDANGEGVWIRVASVYLNYNDEELAAHVHDEESAKLFVALMEDIKDTIDLHKNRVEMFERFQMRLAVAVARYDVTGHTIQ